MPLPEVVSLIPRLVRSRQLPLQLKQRLAAAMVKAVCRDGSPHPVEHVLVPLAHLLRGPVDEGSKWAAWQADAGPLVAAAAQQLAAGAATAEQVQVLLACSKLGLVSSDAQRVLQRVQPAIWETLLAPQESSASVARPRMVVAVELLALLHAGLPSGPWERVVARTCAAVQENADTAPRGAARPMLRIARATANAGWRVPAVAEHLAFVVHSCSAADVNAAWSPAERAEAAALLAWHDAASAEDALGTPADVRQVQLAPHTSRRIVRALAARGSLWLPPWSDAAVKDVHNVLTKHHHTDDDSAPSEAGEPTAGAAIQRLVQLCLPHAGSSTSSQAPALLQALAHPAVSVQAAGAVAYLASLHAWLQQVCADATTHEAPGTLAPFAQPRVVHSNASTVSAKLLLAALTHEEETRQTAAHDALTARAPPGGVRATWQWAGDSDQAQSIRRLWHRHGSPVTPASLAQSGPQLAPSSSERRREAAVLAKLAFHARARLRAGLYTAQRHDTDSAPAPSDSLPVATTRQLTWPQLLRCLSAATVWLGATACREQA